LLELVFMKNAPVNGVFNQQFTCFVLPVAEAGGGFLKVKSKPPTGTVTPPKAYAVGRANAGNSTGLLQKIILGGFLVLESPLTLVAITPPKANAAR
jgi:hypothetical protein